MGVGPSLWLDIASCVLASCNLLVVFGHKHYAMAMDSASISLLSDAEDDIAGSSVPQWATSSTVSVFLPSGPEFIKIGSRQ